jgi:hypothetical protein
MNIFDTDIGLNSMTMTTCPRPLTIMQIIRKCLFLQSNEVSAEPWDPSLITHRYYVSCSLVSFYHRFFDRLDNPLEKVLLLDTTI